MWKHRRLEDNEVPDQLHEFYHHLVVESQSKQTTRIIFHQFHPKPRKEELTSTGDMMVDEHVPANLSVIRERFKGRCALVYSQSYDPDTGAERREALGETAPADLIGKEEHRRLLEPPPSVLGSQYFGAQSSYVDDLDYDATMYRRELGICLTSPRSDQSSGWREYNSTEPTAHVVGWVEVMCRTQSPDSVLNTSTICQAVAPPSAFVAAQKTDSMMLVRLFRLKAAGTVLCEDLRPLWTGKEGDHTQSEPGPPRCSELRW